MSEGKLVGFSLTDKLTADCVVSDGCRVGEIYEIIGRHINVAGQPLVESNALASFYCWRPHTKPGDSQLPYWQIDCYPGPLAENIDPKVTGRSLLDALLREGLCARPVGVMLHGSQYLDQVFPSEDVQIPPPSC